MPDNEKIIVKSLKEKILPVEYSLLIDWSKYLEFKQKGTTLYYFQLQTFVTPESGRAKEKNVFPTLGKLCERCNISHATALKINDLLVKFKFIKIKSGKAQGVPNEYTILELPSFPENLSKAHLKREAISLRGKTFDKLAVEKPESIIEKLKAKKAVDSWNCNDIINFYKQCYRITFKDEPKQKFNMQDRGSINQMLEEYGGEKTKAAIEYAVKNWAELGYVNGYPSIRAIFGYRETLVPEATLGKLSKKRKGQYAGHTKDKDVTEW